MRLKRVATEVWLASIRPETRWLWEMYGDFLDMATWMEAGPQGMNFAISRSRMRRRDLFTCFVVAVSFPGRSWTVWGYQFTSDWSASP